MGLNTHELWPCLTSRPPHFTLFHFPQEMHPLVAIAILLDINITCFYPVDLTPFLYRSDVSSPFWKNKTIWSCLLQFSRMLHPCFSEFLFGTLWEQLLCLVSFDLSYLLCGFTYLAGSSVLAEDLFCKVSLQEKSQISSVNSSLWFRSHERSPCSTTKHDIVQLFPLLCFLQAMLMQQL